MKTLLVTLVAAVVLLALALALLGVKALFVKGGEFPSGHVHDLPRLKRRARARLDSIHSKRKSKPNTEK